MSQNSGLEHQLWKGSNKHLNVPSTDIAANNQLRQATAPALLWRAWRRGRPEQTSLCLSGRRYFVCARYCERRFHALVFLGLSNGEPTPRRSTSRDEERWYFARVCYFFALNRCLCWNPAQSQRTPDCILCIYKHYLNKQPKLAKPNFMLLSTTVTPLLATSAESIPDLYWYIHRIDGICAPFCRCQLLTRISIRI